MSNKKTHSAVAVAMGTAGAVVSKTALAPVTRVQTLWQTQGELLRSGRLDTPYRRVLGCITRTYQTEGFLAFWRGNLAACLKSVSSPALNFVLKDAFKATGIFRYSKDDSGLVRLTKNVAAGGGSGALTLTLVYSLSFVETRLITDVLKKGQERQFRGIIDVYRKTFATHGISGLYRGFVISCVGIGVYRGAYFGFYDTLKPVLLGPDSSILGRMALGYLVTITAGLVAYPFDTIRKRRIVNLGAAVEYKGSMDCAKLIIRQEGFMALMRGAGINVMLSVAGAAMLVGYDILKQR